MAYTFLAISLQAFFSLYFKSIKHCCDTWKIEEQINEPDQEKSKSCELCTDQESKSVKSAKYCALGLSTILSGIVLDSKIIE